MPTRQEETYQRKLHEVEGHLSLGEYALCVRDCGVLFERILRQLYHEILRKTKSAGERERYHACERAVAGRRNLSFREFELGDLIQLFRKAKAWDAVRRLKGSDLSKMARIKWETVKRLRDRAAHGNGRSPLTLGDDEALLMYLWVKILLYDTALLGRAAKAGTARKAPPQRCPGCDMNLRKQWRFCPLCGRQLGSRCPNCDRDVEPGHKICRFCSATLEKMGAGDLAKAKHAYRQLCKGAYLDQVVGARERRVLEEKRLELGLSVRQTEEIEKTCVAPEVIEYGKLLELAFIDGRVNKHERKFLQASIERLRLEPELAEHLEREHKKTLKRRSRQ